MTVNELIAKLRMYASEGHGDQEATICSSEWDYDPIVDVCYLPDEGRFKDRGVVQLTSEHSVPPHAAGEDNTELRAAFLAGYNYRDLAITGTHCDPRQEAFVRYPESPAASQAAPEMPQLYELMIKQSREDLHSEDSATDGLIVWLADRVNELERTLALNVETRRTMQNAMNQAVQHLSALTHITQGEGP